MRGAPGIGGAEGLVLGGGGSSQVTRGISNIVGLLRLLRPWVAWMGSWA